MTDIQHSGMTNTYTFIHAGKKRILKPMDEKSIRSSLDLTVSQKMMSNKNVKPVTDSFQVEEGNILSVKKKVPKPTTKPRTTSLQAGEDDVNTSDDAVSLDTSSSSASATMSHGHKLAGDKKEGLKLKASSDTLGTIPCATPQKEENMGASDYCMLTKLMEAP